MSRKVWCSKKKGVAGCQSSSQKMRDTVYPRSEGVGVYCLIFSLLTNACIFCDSIGGKLLMAQVVNEDKISIGVLSNRPGETDRGLLSNFINYIFGSTDYMAKL